MKAQTKANKRWQEKNKEYSKYLSDRSRCRSFIKNSSTTEDLEELIKLIEDRREFLAQDGEFLKENELPIEPAD